MTRRQFMAEAARLAEEAVDNDWGGPFGAVIVQKGEIVSRGQNRVLLTGDVTAHAEIEAIRKAIQIVNPFAPSISPQNRDKSTLRLRSRPRGSPDAVLRRAQMLDGMEMYSTGQPCPMCMGAIYWARLRACYFGCDVEMTKEIGFDDAFQYEEFKLPLDKRLIKMEQIYSELCRSAYQLWMEKKDRHYY